MIDQSAAAGSIDASELIVGVKIGDDVRAYPHAILNWHEVVNDRYEVRGFPERATLSYCPLTGSAVLWKSFGLNEDQTFGTSGALYNSNLVLYDRATSSYWSQMMEQAILGERVTWIPERFQVVETTWGTWQAMYPETRLLSSRATTTTTPTAVSATTTRCCSTSTTPLITVCTARSACSASTWARPRRCTRSAVSRTASRCSTTRWARWM